MRNPPIENPTLRDRLVQTVGMQRWACRDPRVAEARRWSEWTAAAETATDADLLAFRREQAETTAVLFLVGRLEQAFLAGQAAYGTGDLYEIPGRDRPDLLRLHRERRTDGPLRDLVVAGLLEARTEIERLAGDPDLPDVVGPFADAWAAIEETVGDTQALDAMPDGALEDTSYHAAFYASVLRTAKVLTHRNEAAPVDEDVADVPAFG